ELASQAAGREHRPARPLALRVSNRLLLPLVSNKPTPKNRCRREKVAEGLPPSIRRCAFPLPPGEGGRRPGEGRYWPRPCPPLIRRCAAPSPGGRGWPKAG